MADFKFNPKVKDFLENKKDVKMLGFFWALYWRWELLIASIFIGLFLFVLLILLIGKLF